MTGVPGAEPFGAGFAGDSSSNGSSESVYRLSFSIEPVLVILLPEGNVCSGTVEAAICTCCWILDRSAGPKVDERRPVALERIRASVRRLPRVFSARFSCWARVSVADDFMRAASLADASVLPWLTAFWYFMKWFSDASRATEATDPSHGQLTILLTPDSDFGVVAGRKQSV